MKLASGLRRSFSPFKSKCVSSEIRNSSVVPPPRTLSRGGEYGTIHKERKQAAAWDLGKGWPGMLGMVPVSPQSGRTYYLMDGDQNFGALAMSASPWRGKF